MKPDYRDRLFATYSATHVAHLDLDDRAKQAWFLRYVDQNYVPSLAYLDRKQADVLEIACNRGHVLSALSTLGFARLTGIDLSADDVARAKTLLPTANIHCASAFDFLQNRIEAFDLIILKALLEHLPKNQVLPLLETIALALKPAGLVLIDVPNMDWLMATHERYMDFTHETGFTRESLAQVMRDVFSNVTVRPCRAPVEPGLKQMVIRLMRPGFILAGKIFLRVIGEGASDTWWYCRSIMATANRPAEPPEWSSGAAPISSLS